MAKIKRFRQKFTQSFARVLDFIPMCLSEESLSVFGREKVNRDN